MYHVFYEKKLRSFFGVLNAFKLNKNAKFKHMPVNSVIQYRILHCCSG